jgi:excisionase family DNA binding protein
MTTTSYGSRKWHTSRTWPGGEWGEAMAQVRKVQRLTQSDIADYLEVSLSTVRQWERGVALPDRSRWQKLEEAMGVPVPDPRVPDHTPAERELIDTLLLVTDELRQLREQLVKNATPKSAEGTTVGDPQVVDVNGAAAYVGVPISLIRRLVAERRVVFYKVGRRVMFRKSDLEQFIEDGKREPGRYEPWQLRNRGGTSPRKSK